MLRRMPLHDRPLASRRHLILALVLALHAWPAAGQTPTTADELAAKMIEAHGGLERWQKIETFTYTVVLFDPAVYRTPPSERPRGLDPGWVHTATVEHGRRRLYQVWPHDGARLADDGTTVWTTGWKRQNPPRFMAQVGYFLLNLPWITQDAAANVTGPGRGALPHDDTEYLTLTLTFDGAHPDEYYKLYIDPVSHRQAGIEFTVTYGALLDLFDMPPEVTYAGPVTHVFDDYVTVDGLTFVSRYHGYGPNGADFGEHVVWGISLHEPFDEERLRLPPDGVVDQSTAERRQPESR